MPWRYFAVNYLPNHTEFYSNNFNYLRCYFRQTPNGMDFLINKELCYTDFYGDNRSCRTTRSSFNFTIISRLSGTLRCKTQLFLRNCQAVYYYQHLTLIKLASRNFIASNSFSTLLWKDKFKIHTQKANA